MGDAEKEEFASLNSTLDYLNFQMDRFLDMCTAMAELHSTYKKNMETLLPRLTDPFATDDNVTASEVSTADISGTSASGSEFLGSQAEEGQLAQSQIPLSVLSVSDTGTVLTPIDTNASALKQATTESVLPAIRSTMTRTSDQENLNAPHLCSHPDHYVTLQNEALEHIKDQKFPSVPEESEEDERSDGEVTTEEEDEETDVEVVDLTGEDDNVLELPRTNLEQAVENKSDETFANEAIEKGIFEMDKVLNERTPSEDKNEMRNLGIVHTLPGRGEIDGNHQESTGLEDGEVEEDVDSEGILVKNEALKETRDHKYPSISEESDEDERSDGELTTEDEDEETDTELICLKGEDNGGLESPPVISEPTEQNESDNFYENGAIENGISEIDKVENERTSSEDKDEIKIPEIVQTLPESNDISENYQKSTSLEEEESLDSEGVSVKHEALKETRDLKSPSISEESDESEWSEGEVTTEDEDEDTDVEFADLTSEDSEDDIGLESPPTNLEQTEQSKSDKLYENEAIENMIFEMDNVEIERTPPEDKDEIRNPDEELEVEDEVDIVVDFTSDDDYDVEPPPTILVPGINSDSETANDANLEEAEENESDKSDGNEAIENVIVEMDKFVNERTQPKEKDEMKHPEFVDTLPESHENRGNTQNSECLEEEEDVELVDLTEDDNGLESPLAPAILTPGINSDSETVNVANLEQAEENEFDKSNENNVIVEIDKFVNEWTPPEDKDKIRNPEFVDTLPQSQENRGNNHKSEGLEEEEDVELVDLTVEDDNGLESPPVPAILTPQISSHYSKTVGSVRYQSEENKSDESYKSETIEKGNFELDKEENVLTPLEDKNEIRNQEIVDTILECDEIHRKNQKSTDLQEEVDVDAEGDLSGGDKEGLRSPISGCGNVPLGGQENLGSNLNVNYSTVGLSSYSCAATATEHGLSLLSTASVICSLSPFRSLPPTTNKSCFSNVLETESDLNGSPFLPRTTNETEIGSRSEGSEDEGPIDLSLTRRQINENERSCGKSPDKTTTVLSGRKKPRKQQMITDDIDIDCSSEPGPEPDTEITFRKIKKIRNYLGKEAIAKPVEEIEEKSKDVPLPEAPPKHGVRSIPIANEVPIEVRINPNQSEQDANVKRKKEKVQTIREIVNQKNIFQRVSEWKLTELLDDFDQIVELENDAGECYDSLLSKIDGCWMRVGTSQTSCDLNRIQELLKGNIGRCTEIHIQMAESGYFLGRIMRHKPRVHQVINKFSKK